MKISEKESGERVFTEEKDQINCTESCQKIVRYHEVADQENMKSRPQNFSNACKDNMHKSQSDMNIKYSNFHETINVNHTVYNKEYSFGLSNHSHSPKTVDHVGSTNDIKFTNYKYHNEKIIEDDNENEEDAEEEIKESKSLPHEISIHDLINNKPADLIPNRPTIKVAMVMPQDFNDDIPESSENSLSKSASPKNNENLNTIIHKNIINKNKVSCNQQDINIQQNVSVNNTGSSRDNSCKEEYERQMLAQHCANCKSGTNSSRSVKNSSIEELKIDSYSNLPSKTSMVSSMVSTSYASTLTPRTFTDILSFIDEAVFLTNGAMNFQFTNIKNILSKSDLSQYYHTQNQYLSDMFNLDLFDERIINLGIEKYLKNFYDIIQTSNCSTIKSIIYVYKLLKDHPTKNVLKYPYNFKNLDRLLNKFNNMEHQIKPKNIQSESEEIESGMFNYTNDNNEDDNYIDRIYLSDVVNLLKCFVSFFWDEKGQILTKDPTIMESLKSNHSKFYFCHNHLSINISVIDMNAHNKPTFQFLMQNLISKCNMITQEDKNQFKNSLLNSVDHEIRTPLNYILINSELCLMELEQYYKSVHRKANSNLKHTASMPLTNVNPFSEKSIFLPGNSKLQKITSSSQNSNKHMHKLETPQTKLTSSFEKFKLASSSEKYKLTNSFENEKNMITPLIFGNIGNQQSTKSTEHLLDYDRIHFKVKHIFDCAKHCHLIIQSLVDFAHMETEKFALNIKKVDIKKIIDEIISLYSFQIQTKNIEIVFNIDEKTMKAIKSWQTDEIRIKIIFSNLIHNAIKFIEDKGTIEISINENEISHQLHIHVKDNGMGIDSKSLKFLRKSLRFPLKKFTKSPTCGIGLGLRFVSALLRYLGKNNESEQLQIQSEVNLETIFSFWMRNCDNTEANDCYSLISKQNSFINKNFLDYNLVNNMISNPGSQINHDYMKDMRFSSKKDSKDGSHFSISEENNKIMNCQDSEEEPSKFEINMEQTQFKKVRFGNIRKKNHDENTDDQFAEAINRDFVKFKKAQTQGFKHGSMKNHPTFGMPYWQSEDEHEWKSERKQRNFSQSRLPKSEIESEHSQQNSSSNLSNIKKDPENEPKDCDSLYNIIEDSDESNLHSKYISYREESKQLFNNGKERFNPLNSDSYNYESFEPESSFLKGLTNNKNSILEKDSESNKSINKGCKCNNIMIVDDEIFNLHTLKIQLDTLYGKNENIFTATNGLIAVELFHAMNQANKCEQCMIFKIIILDLNMPKMDGGRACTEIIDEIERLKIQNNTENIDNFRYPIIIGQTAYTDSDTMKYGLSCGMKLMLNKPTTTIQFYDIFTTLGVNDGFSPALNYNNR